MDEDLKPQCHGPKAQDNRVSWAEKRRQVLATALDLHRQGWSDWGPSEVAIALYQGWTLLNGVPHACRVHPVLRELVAEGQLEEVALGSRRHRYRVPASRRQNTEA